MFGVVLGYNTNPLPPYTSIKQHTMYAQRLQLSHYGPISSLDITFPIPDGKPLPTVLVGANGSGKSIALSHIVNGILYTKDLSYPESREVHTGKAYKLRHPSYIRDDSSFFAGRVDFDNALYVSELQSGLTKSKYGDSMPRGTMEPFAVELWDKMRGADRSYFASNISDRLRNLPDADKPFANSCALYFPSNRFEEPAWLNSSNLNARAEYVDASLVIGETPRTAIALTPLKANQNWLFDLIYDRAAFELNIAHIPFAPQGADQTISVPVFRGYQGDAENMYNAATQIVRTVLGRPDIRFGIGTRRNRRVSVQHQPGNRTLIPNLFQMSSGEASLLNLFLTILRDFDMTGASFRDASDVRGIVVVDEIDLHLHATHQYQVLPNLIRLLPNVQFIVTSHSPLFVLGMEALFGEDGFALHRLPEGYQISPEEFSEFASAYRAFAKTGTFAHEIRHAIASAQKPTIYVEGTTDRDYLSAAAKLLGYEGLLAMVDLKHAGGDGDLKSIWKAIPKLDDHFTPVKTILISDCDSSNPVGTRGRVVSIRFPEEEHPIRKGVENLFSKETLERARAHKVALVDVAPAYTRPVRGRNETTPEDWSVHPGEKRNLCDWICESGTAEDFKYFRPVFESLKRELAD